MDKIKWLQQMVEQNPNDPQGYLWLGKELADHQRWLEAVQSYSTGLSHCTDVALQKDIIHELTKASSQIQQGASLPNGNEDLAASPIEDDYVATIAEEEQDHLEGCSDIQVENGKLKNLEPKFKVIDGDATKKAMKKVNETVTFADVAGLEDLKKTINLRIISPFYNKGLFAKFRKKVGVAFFFMDHLAVGKPISLKRQRENVRLIFIPFILQIF